MELIDRIKETCRGNKCCKCELYNVCPNDTAPSLWDIEAIRNVLGAEIDGAVVGEEKSCTRVDGAVESVVGEIVVPKKWEKP